MGNYSDKENSCRVDFFKQCGKWYTSEAVEFPGEVFHKPTVEATKIAVYSHLKGRCEGMRAVCVEPYCSHPFPVSFTV